MDYKHIVSFKRAIKNMVSVRRPSVLKYEFPQGPNSDFGIALLDGASRKRIGKGAILPAAVTEADGEGQREKDHSQEVTSM